MKRLRRFIPVALLAAACLATGTAWGDGGPTVLFDQSHGQKFLVGEAGRLQLSELAEIFRNQGFRVTSPTEPITDRVLAKCDALVLSGPFRPYTAEEVAVIGRFVEKGGRLAVMLHTAPPLAGLLERFGVEASPGVIHDPDQAIEGDSLNFRVTRLAPHQLCVGLRRFSLYGVWAVTNTGNHATIIAATSPGAWLDLGGDRRLPASKAGSSFGVAVAGHYGRGRFVVFGDDAIFQNRFLDADNRQLARNLAAWLK